MNKNNKIKFIDLFAGIGGFHKAINNVFKKDGIIAECVFVSEIDDAAKNTYSKNYNWDKESMIDINKIDIKNMPDFDILFGGFPCQSFSNAGKKLGFNDKLRGKLIFKVIEIIKSKLPSFILLENVSHIVNHNNGNTWNTIINKIKSIGYITTVKPLIISPTDIGEPQNRKRVFIPFIKSTITNLKELKNIEFDKDIKMVNPKKYIKNSLNKNETKYVLNDQIQNILNAWKEFIEHFHEKKIYKIPVLWIDNLNDINVKKKEFNNYPAWKQKYLKTMNNFYMENKEYIDNWIKKYNVNKWKNKRDKKIEWQADNTKFNDVFIQFRQSGIRCRKPTNISTLVAMVQIPIIYRNVDELNEKKWTYLTPREISKFQGFDDDFILCENDHQAYKQFGNCVNIKVVEYIITNYLKKNIIKYLNEK